MKKKFTEWEKIFTYHILQGTKIQGIKRTNKNNQFLKCPSTKWAEEQTHIQKNIYGQLVLKKQKCLLFLTKKIQTQTSMRDPLPLVRMASVAQTGSASKVSEKCVGINVKLTQLFTKQILKIIQSRKPTTRCLGVNHLKGYRHSCVHCNAICSSQIHKKGRGVKKMRHVDTKEYSQPSEKMKSWSLLHDWVWEGVYGETSES